MQDRDDRAQWGGRLWVRCINTHWKHEILVIESDVVAWSRIPPFLWPSRVGRRRFIGYGDDVPMIRSSAVNLHWLTVQDCASTFRWRRLILLATGSRWDNPGRPAPAVPRSGSLHQRNAETPVATQVIEQSLLLCAEVKSAECWFEVSRLDVALKPLISFCQRLWCQIREILYHWRDHVWFVLLVAEKEPPGCQDSIRPEELRKQKIISGVALHHLIQCLTPEIRSGRGPSDPSSWGAMCQESQFLKPKAFWEGFNITDPTGSSVWLLRNVSHFFFAAMLVLRPHCVRTYSALS